MVQTLADAALALARGEALQRVQAFCPDTSVEDYLLRCSLKTGKLFEAACRLGGSHELGGFGLSLGLAFQIADDILDCTGRRQTGKAPGSTFAGRPRCRSSSPLMRPLVWTPSRRACRDAPRVADGALERARLALECRTAPPGVEGAPGCARSFTPSPTGRLRPSSDIDARWDRP
jgi:hypothetical protein